jgi:hypothetical protein
VLSNFPTDCSGKLEGKKRIKQLKAVVYYLYFTSLNFYESFRISAEAIKLSNAEFELTNPWAAGVQLQESPL